MKYIRNCIPMTCFLFFWVIALGTFAVAQTMEAQLPEAVSSVRTALVRIHVVSTEYTQGREIKSESFGSGIIISADGYVVTNHHVIENAEYVVCTLTDRREVEAKVVGTDPLADIAVIKLPSANDTTYPYANFGDSSALRVGQTVYAMGSPLSISQSVTEGIVSNTEMVMPEMYSSNSLKLEGEDVGSIVLWIGHDAQIEPGNSGGPLVDEAGQVVGINEISIGLSGAIPSNLASHICKELIKNGKVERSWFGVTVQPILKSNSTGSGVLISDIASGTPGDKADLKSGDILLAIDDDALNARFREQIPNINQYIYSLPVGKNIALKILRNDVEQIVNLTTTERPTYAEKEHEIKNWGICGKNINYYILKEMQLESQDGVMITSFLPSGPAGSAKPTFSEKDIITKVGGRPIKDIDSLRDVTKELIGESQKAIPTIVEFQRNKNQFATVVRLGKAEATASGQEITKAWLPIETQPLTRELAKAMDMAKLTGVRVTRVFPDSVASRAGIDTGDIIIKLDGEEIPAEEMDDYEVFPSMIRQYEIGSKVKLDIIRNTMPLVIEVELDAAPKPESDYEKYDDEIFEFQARNIAFTDRSKGKVTKESQGVFVNSVTNGSWAALAQLKTADVITSINGTAIDDIEKLKITLSEIAELKPEYVVFRVQRGIYTIYLEVKPQWQEQ